MSDHPGLAGNPGQWPKAVFYVAILFSAYQIIGAAFHPFSSQVLRAGHVGFVLLMVYLCFPMRGQGRPWTPLAWALGLAGLGDDMGVGDHPVGGHGKAAAMAEAGDLAFLAEADHDHPHDRAAGDRDVIRPRGRGRRHEGQHGEEQ